MNFNQEYWQQRWEKGETGWDIGFVSTPIKEYIDQLQDRSIKILIPGCGNAYEAAYLIKQGFVNTYVIDISESAIANIRKRIPNLPPDQIIHGDFFEHTGQYDLIIEQTFFCALDPSLREQYVEHMHLLLKPNGRRVGVMFNVPLYDDHPPFGGNESLYRSLFEPYFEIDIMAPCYNSIPQRSGSEVFVNFRRKL